MSQQTYICRRSFIHLKGKLMTKINYNLLLLYTTWTLLHMYRTKIKIKIFNDICHVYGIYGWIAWGWEAHFRNYRHYIYQAPWTDYPISLTRHGLTRTKAHSFAKWIAVSGNRTAITCVVIEVHVHYTTAPSTFTRFNQSVNSLVDMIFQSLFINSGLNQNYLNIVQSEGGYSSIL